jgi:CRISPR-associated protein Cst2
MKKNLFASILTFPAPSANYRGESEENRTVLQKIMVHGHEYAFISPEAIRNALREILRGYDESLCNRERLHNEKQLAVRFKDYPWPERYIDDFFFGYFVAKREQIPASIQEERNFQFKRDSILRNNLALALEPYRQDTVFTQSPSFAENKQAPWQNSEKSALVYREVSHTAFQYPIALNLNDCKLDTRKTGKQYKYWLRLLLQAIAELNGVAGNAARSYFEMAPASIVLRITPSLVAGYDTYGFQQDGTFPEVIEGILAGDYPGDEFILGGQLVREKLDKATVKKLEAKGVRLYRMANQALDAVCQEITGESFMAGGYTGLKGESA